MMGWRYGNKQLSAVSSEQRRGTQGVFPAGFAFYSCSIRSTVSDICPTISADRKNENVWVETEVCTKWDNRLRRLKWFTYKERTQQKACLIFMWQHQGQLGSDWEDWCHACTQRLTGTCRTDMWEECQLTSSPSPPPTLCRANSGRAARGCEWPHRSPHDSQGNPPPLVWHISSASHQQLFKGTRTPQNQN